MGIISHWIVGFSFGTQVAKWSTPTGSIPASRRVSRTKRWRSFSGSRGTSVTAANSEAKGDRASNTSRSVRVKLAIRRSTRSAERLHIASRAISAVTIVDAHGVAGKGKLRYAHRLPDAFPESSRFPDLRAVTANHRTAAWSADTAELAWRSNVLCVQPLEFGIQVIRVDSFCGANCSPLERVLFQSSMRICSSSLTG